MNHADKKILVVDDTLFMVTMIEKALEAADYNVTTAFSGEDALEKIRSQHFDLILLDVIMPGMSGFELCEILRGDFRYNLIPIIIITGQAEEEDRLKGLELGADDYVVKPFVKRELLARVHNTLVRLERMRGVNPMTGLCGNNDIEAEMQRRMRENMPFAVIYFDLNLFKPYNDVYGFANGDRFIQMTSEAIVSSVADIGAPTDFVGHIGGDDFIAIVEPMMAIPIAEKVIERFEARKLDFYGEEDRKNGYILSKDRRTGEPLRFHFTGISAAIVMSEKNQFQDTVELARIAAETKSKAKKMQQSAYYVSE